MAVATTAGETTTMNYLLTDHLGSVAAVLDDSGGPHSEQRYLPFGQVRTDWPVAPKVRITETDFGYTGQRSLMSDIGLMDYKARFYDPTIGRFIQPDTIISSYANPQSLNRFSYVLGNPVLLNDPSGHWACEDAYSCEHSDTIESQELAKKRERNKDPKEPVVPGHHTGDEEGSGGYFHPLVTTTTTGTSYNWYTRLQDFSSLFNWSLTSPGEFTLYQTPGYPWFGGTRLFWQTILTQDNGSPLTISPTSYSVGNMTATFSGEFRYKMGPNSISAINASFGEPFQPWAAKLSVQVGMPDGRTSQRFGAEFTARPDNLVYAGAPAAVYSGVAYVGMVIQMLGSLGPCPAGACH